MFKSFPKSLPALKSLPQAIGLPFLSTQEDAQLRFRSGDNGIKRLYGDEVIPLTDVEYWSQYYTLFGSIQDVYGLISAQDVRQTLIAQPQNLANLLAYLSHHLMTLIPSDLFPTPASARPSLASSVVNRTIQGQDTTRECLNCLRVLGRVLVIVLEAEGTAREGGVSAGEAFAREHLWARSTVSVSDAHVGEAEARGEEQFTIADSDDEGEGEGEGADREASDPLRAKGKASCVEPKTEEAPSLAERLFSCTVDLLFCAGFTLPESVRGSGPEGDKINYVIWDKGIGSTVSIGTSAELDRNKTEVLRFLLILLSSPIYTSPGQLATTVNAPLSHLVHSLERRLVLSLLCSLLNTSLAVSKPNTVGALPYNHLISKAAEERAVLVRACLMSLLVALDYTLPADAEPEMGRDVKEDNAFRYFVSKLHRKEDFSSILKGILAVFEEQTAVSSAYLPGSKRPVPYILEIFMLLWQLVDLNKRFRAYIFDSNNGSDLIAYILLTCLDLKDDPAQHGLLRLGAYLLQNLSAEQAFAEALNAPVKLKVPSRWAVPISSQGSMGNGSDLLIISIYSIATTPGLNPLFPALCITIANIAPHLRGLGSVASQKLLQLFKAFSAPNFLLADEGHPRLVYCLLDTFNSILHHQLNENPNLVYSILRSHKDFQTLGTFTLVSGLREIQRRKALRSANADGANKPSLDSPGLKRTNSEIDMLAEKAALIGREIGEEDSHRMTDGLQTQPLTSPGLDEAANQPNTQGDLSKLPPPPIIVQQVMSEKARGKMRAVQPEDPTSPGLEDGDGVAPEVPDEELMKVAQAGVGPNRYVPTQEWVASWQKGLPLDVALIAISELLPKIQDQSASASGAPSSKVFRLLKEVDLSEVLPPAPPISSRRFQWSAASAVWLTSLLWGDIYVSGLQAGASGVCVWRDTSVRLFGIKQAPERTRGAQAQVGKMFKMIVSGSTQ